MTVGVPEVELVESDLPCLKVLGAERRCQRPPQRSGHRPCGEKRSTAQQEHGRLPSETVPGYSGQTRRRNRPSPRAAALIPRAAAPERLGMRGTYPRGKNGPRSGGNKSPTPLQISDKATVDGAIPAQRDMSRDIIAMLEEPQAWRNTALYRM